MADLFGGGLPEIRRRYEPAEAPVNETPRAALYREGLAILVSLGLRESTARAVISKWLKKRDNPQELLATLQWAYNRGVIEPIGYVTRIWTGGNDKRSFTDSIRSLAEQARELEREAGLGGPPHGVRGD